MSAADTGDGLEATASKARRTPGGSGAPAFSAPETPVGWMVFLLGFRSIRSRWLNIDISLFPVIAKKKL